MFWIFILAIGIAFVFVKLGMLSVWATVLSGALKLLLFVILALTGVIIWQKVFSKK